jgi:NAD(P)H-nitrite reductase large subunit
MEEIICYCRNVTKREIETAILQGAKTLKDIQDTTGACTGKQCKELNPKGRCCSVEINALLNNREDRQPQKCSCCS